MTVPAAIGCWVLAALDPEKTTSLAVSVVPESFPLLLLLLLLLSDGAAPAAFPLLVLLLLLLSDGAGGGGGVGGGGIENSDDKSILRTSECNIPVSRVVATAKIRHGRIAQKRTSRGLILYPLLTNPPTC
jgi:hypothetical protein